MWDRTEAKIEEYTEMKLTLIRHGATKSNLEHRYLSKIDESLSEEGKRYLQKKKEEGIYSMPVMYGQLFISPMLRCRQTAEILFPGIPYQYILEWKEINFGIFEGKNYEELSKNFAYQAWIDSGGELPFPEGESRESFKKRVLQGFDKMLSCLRKSEICSSKREIIAVVHGGTIMALCSSFLGGEYFDYQVKCGEGYECYFRYSDKNIKLLEMQQLC